MGSAETDIVREKSSAINIIMTVHCIRRPDQGYRDLLTRDNRRLIIGLNQVKPIFDS